MENNFTSLSLYTEKPQEGITGVSIYINDIKIDPAFRLVSVWVRKEVNKIGKAELTFEAWSSVELEKNSDSESPVFTPGNTIRIEVGYEKTTDELPIFEGLVTAQSLEIDKDDGTLKIECRDFMYPSTITSATKGFESGKEILSEIIKAYSPLKGTVEQIATPPLDVIQHNESDWDFLLLHARSRGLCVITEGKSITIKKPALSGSPVHKLSYAENIVSMKAKLQASQQIAKVTAKAWSSKEQKIKTVTVSNTALNDQGDLSSSDLAKKMKNKELVLHTSGYTDDDSLKRWAESQLQERNLDRTLGNIVCKGSAKITAGCIVELENVGKHFNGNAYCGAVEHEIKDANWLTTACMGYSGDSAKTNENGKETLSNPSAVSGLQIGKVVRIDEDPTKEYNIQVEIPVFKNDGINNVWARLSSFWASSQYGAFFIPDVGDEVVLGFFDNDSNKAVILGSLYSSKQAPANLFDKKNNIRSIVTKSKLKLEFEEEKKIITIQTPGKNTIEISDEGKTIKLTDENSNKIEMSRDGIFIESAKNISLKAKGGITLEAGTNVDLKGKSAINLKSTNIEVKADGSFTAKGSAKAELSASGQAIIKGAMVMIN